MELLIHQRRAWIRAALGGALLLGVGSYAQASLPDYGFPPRESCRPQGEQELPLYSEDIRKNLTMAELKPVAREVYALPGRLNGRAYFDRHRGAYIMEVKTQGDRRKPVVLNPRFIRSVIRNVEIALERRYADEVLMADLGHSHFYYPPELEPEIQGYPSDQTDRIYQRLVDLSSLRMLYHTAEYLVLLEGPDQKTLPTAVEPLWRYMTRNVLGDAQSGENVSPLFAWSNASYNTVGEIAGYAKWSAGFNISANEKGCFPFRQGGEMRYFDLSWDDLPYRSADAAY